MERPIFKPVGTPAEQLDTPALVVDLSVLENNIRTMASFFEQSDAKLRPHVESHRCPAVVHMQLSAGGTVGGICVTTLGQAEVFSQSGISDIFVANLVVTRQKIDRLCALARRASMTVAVDSPGNVRDLSEAASARGVELDVVVYVNTGQNGCGVEPGQAVVDLARQVRDAAGLSFAGLMAYDGSPIMEDSDQLATDSRGRVQQVLDAREMVEKAGIEIRVVSVGGTHNYEIAASMGGVTEVPAGSYALMDQRYRRYGREFEPAARVLGTVASVPDAGTAVTDAGQKAIGADTGLPVVDDLPGIEVKSLSAEHGSLIVPDSLEGRLGVGDKVWYTPWDIGTCVNLHDYIHAVRDGTLEVVWEVLARGRYR
jgi:D-serine deaminase-like pyridoxal phosphate-dependent protein